MLEQKNENISQGLACSVNITDIAFLPYFLSLLQELWIRLLNGDFSFM